MLTTPAGAISQAKSLYTPKLISRGGPAVDVLNQIYQRSIAKPTPVPSDAKPGAHHWWQAARGRPDPMLDIYWYVTLPVLNGGDTKLSWEYVEEATLPLIEFEEVANYRAGKSFHYPNHYNINPLQLKFYGDVEGKVLKYLYTWQSLILNQDTGLYYPPNVYKMPIIITILDAAQMSVAVIQYYGCWPTSIDSIPLVSSQSGRVTPTASFRVDEMRLLVGKFADSERPSVLDSLGKDYPTSIAKLPSVFPDTFSSVPGNLFR